MSIVIKKIGSSLLKSDEDFKKIATYLADAYHKNPRMIVVVSALQGETDRLIHEAENISTKQCHARELLLSLGEQKSCALLGLALELLNIPYTIYCGTCVHIVKGKGENDYIVSESDFNVHLGEGIVIVGGFHVTDLNMKLINLGRGGSDFTAIILAHLFKTKACELIKDVPGVYNTNPEWGPLGQYFERLSFNKMLELADQGVPIVQKQALLFAQQHNVSFRVTDLSGNGTWIG